MLLYYPIKPYYINQGFGANPDYYARFKDSLGNPEKGHMGIDLQAAHGQPVYAAHDGMARYVHDSHGGQGVYNRTNEFQTIYWHLVGDTDANFPCPIRKDGVEVAVKTGDLIGYADNTGAPFESNGTHLHFGFMSIDASGNATDPSNGFGGCTDPTTFFTGTFAQDVPRLNILESSLVSVLQKLLAYYQNKTKI